MTFWKANVAYEILKSKYSLWHFKHTSYLRKADDIPIDHIEWYLFDNHGSYKYLKDSPIEVFYSGFVGLELDLYI
jgi:hypothetical protein